MNYLELVNPELKSLVSFPSYNKYKLIIANPYLTLMCKKISLLPSLNHRSIKINGYKNRRIKMDVYEPESASEKLPALLFVHGGAFGYKASPHHKQLAMLYAQEANCRVFFPDYGLAPANPYPAGLEDVFSAYEYILNHCQDLKIDSSKIGIAGDSAGGFLAACVCINCEKRSVKMPCFQLLVYPLTGIKLETDSIKKYTDTPIWNSKNNVNMWKYYLKNQEIDFSNSPMHYNLPESIPPTYIETAEYDCLHDDGILFAEKLREKNIEVQLNETKGTVHGYDSVFDAEITKENVKKRLDFIKKYF